MTKKKRQRQKVVLARKEVGGKQTTANEKKILARKKKDERKKKSGQTALKWGRPERKSGGDLELRQIRENNWWEGRKAVAWATEQKRKDHQSTLRFSKAVPGT